MKEKVPNSHFRMPLPAQEILDVASNNPLLGEDGVRGVVINLMREAAQDRLETAGGVSGALKEAFSQSQGSK